MKKDYYDNYSEDTQEVFTPAEEEFGCNFCWDKKHKTSYELFFFDAANNMRICRYCPYCGRKFE